MEREITAGSKGGEGHEETIIMKQVQLFSNKSRRQGVGLGSHCLALTLILLTPSPAFCAGLQQFGSPSSANQAQEMVDKMVATVNAGVLPECSQICLITYSDILWQLALQPGTPIDNPSSDSLNRSLRLLIDQRLILQEAQKLPTIDPTAAEIKSARDELVKHFAPTEFQTRSFKVGLTSEKLDEIVEQRLRIEKYLDFRFRNFVIISEQEIGEYYKDVFVPRFRRRNPGSVVPSLQEARDDIEKTLSERKVESDTDAFLDGARDRAEIVMLSSV
jgi:hypothetical protein